MNRWLRKLKKKAILPAAVFLIAAAAIGTTYAWQTWDLGITNHLKSHDTDVRVEEEGFNPLSGHKPVSFKNTGSSSVFLRISYSEYWVKGEGAVKEDHKPEWTNGDEPTYVLSNSMNGDTGSREVAKKKWTNVWAEYVPESDEALPPSPEWIDGGDGWFYYTKILKAGESTNKILEEVKFSAQLPEEYEGANYRLYFKAEVVQCSDSEDSKTLNRDTVNQNAVKAIFGKEINQINYETGTVSWK